MKTEKLPPIAWLGASTLRLAVHLGRGWCAMFSTFRMFGVLNDKLRKRA